MFVLKEKIHTLKGVFEFSFFLSIFSLAAKVIFFLLSYFQVPFIHRSSLLIFTYSPCSLNTVLFELLSGSLTVEHYETEANQIKQTKGNCCLIDILNSQPRLKTPQSLLKGLNSWFKWLQNVSEEKSVSFI